jgi:hypothetical protein
MPLTCTIKHLPAGWLAIHDSPDVGHLEVRALTRKEVLEKIEGEIRYRLELCPCTGETYRHIEIEAVDSP